MAKKTLKLFTLRRNNNDGSYGLVNPYWLFMFPPRAIMTFSSEDNAMKEMMRFHEIQRVGIKIIPIEVTYEE